MSKRKNKDDGCRTILSTLHGGLTKNDIYNYYSDELVRETINNYITGRYVTILQTISPEYIRIINRIDSEKLIIEKNKGDANDKTDFEYWIKNYASEFHVEQNVPDTPIVGEFIINLIPKNGYPFHLVSENALKIKELFRESEIFFNGKNSYQIRVQNPTNNWIEDSTKAYFLHELGKIGDGIVTTLEIKANEKIPHLYIDVGQNNSNRKLIVPYSLNITTGLSCVKVEDPTKFKLVDAALIPKIKKQIEGLCAGKYENISKKINDKISGKSSCIDGIKKLFSGSNVKDANLMTIEEWEEDLLNSIPRKDFDKIKITTSNCNTAVRICTYLVKNHGKILTLNKIRDLEKLEFSGNNKKFYNKLYKYVREKL